LKPENKLKNKIIYISKIVKKIEKKKRKRNKKAYMGRPSG
jgi:hypothetical protein